MGLIYQFPVQLEKNYAFYQNSSLIVKSYGLPKIFWFYYLFFLIFYTTLFMLLFDSLLLFQKIDPYFGSFILLFSCLIPFLPLFFFYYEKTLILKEDHLTILKKSFLVFSRKKFQLNKLILKRYLDSPNYARIHQKHASFQNKGYFILLGANHHESFFIDRSSQGRDLFLLVKIFQDYNKKLSLRDQTILETSP